MSYKNENNHMRERSTFPLAGRASPIRSHANDMGRMRVVSLHVFRIELR